MNEEEAKLLITRYRDRFPHLYRIFKKHESQFRKTYFSSGKTNPETEEDDSKG